MRRPLLTLEGARAGSRAWHRALTGAQLLVGSFLLMVAVGTAGLLWLPGLYQAQGLGFVDALFTATSAVCVTGLIVVDTATYFTFWGQLWILILIQAGGLGILTFTTLTLTALGRRASLHLEEATGGHAGYLRHIEASGLLRTVMAVTFTLEGVGAAFLWLLWRQEFGAGPALWHAVFNAISAFCNAGFSTFSDSLMGFQGQGSVLLVVSALVIVGGLGFVVLEDLRVRLLRRETRRLSVHTKLVLATTAFLLLVGWGAFAAFEWTGQLATLGTWDKLANAGFMSVTPRTAGFNSVNYDAVSNASLFLTILLMLVGGSPGSTAGGFKTVVLALLFLTLAARLRGEEDVHVFDRTIPRGSFQRAAGMVMGGLLILGGAIFALLVTEVGTLPVGDRHGFVMVVFEAHSAFATVGLSMGITPTLSGLGRVVVTCLMFLGRVGPPAVIAAMTVAVEHRRADFRYGHEDVILG